MVGNIVKYTYDGVHQLLCMGQAREDDKEVLLSERNETKVGQKTGEPKLPSSEWRSQW